MVVFSSYLQWLLLHHYKDPKEERKKGEEMNRGGTHPSHLRGEWGLASPPPFLFLSNSFLPWKQAFFWDLLLLPLQSCPSPPLTRFRRERSSVIVFAEDTHTRESSF